MHERKGLISVIVPVYNVERYLDRCVKSLGEQTYRELEIILVDDGSRDGSPKLCDAWRDTDARIIAIHQQNAGRAAARNAGLDRASGEYIVFVDSDDFVHPSMIKTLLDIGEANDCDIVQCGYIRGSGSAFPPMRDRQYKAQPMGAKEAFLTRKFTAGVWRRLYRAGLFENERFPQGMHYEDEAVSYRVGYAAKRIALTDEPLYYYFRNPTSAMLGDRSNYLSTDFMPIMEERLGFFEGRDRSLYELSVECYAKAIMMYYARSDPGGRESGNMDAILGRYRELYGRLMGYASVAVSIKAQMLAFMLCPPLCAWLWNRTDKKYHV